VSACRPDPPADRPAALQNHPDAVLCHIAPTEGALFEILGDGGAEVGGGAADGVGGGAEDLLAVFLRPFLRSHRGVERLLEHRHDVAGEQFVAAHGLLAGGPFVGAEQDAAEAALAVAEQALDALGDGLGGADEGGAHFDAVAQVGAAGGTAERVLETGGGLDRQVVAHRLLECPRAI
jgi:hypothetical protein